MQQELLSDSGSAFAENVGKDIIQLDIGNSETVQGAVFLADREACQFEAVTHKIAQLPDGKGRDKAAGNEVVLKDVGDPLSVPSIGFLAAESLDVFGMSENHFTGRFEHVVDGDPVFPRRLHTNVPAAVIREPLSKQTEVARESGKPAPFVSRNALVVGCRDTSNDEGLVDVDSTADGVNDFERHIKPPHKVM